MCGRYDLSSISGRIIAARFGARLPRDIAPLTEVRPTNDVPVIRMDDDERTVEPMHWGFVPPWAQDIKIGQRMINARAEGIDAKPAFRDAVHKRRCLVPAAAFYEWRIVQGEKHKQAIRFSVLGEDIFAMAGIWSAWKGPDGTWLHSVAHITCSPNALVAGVHDRMPAILLPEREQQWLDPQLPNSELPHLLSAYPAEAMIMTPWDLRNGNAL